MSHYLGIDPGQKGGLAYLTPEGVIEYTLMPSTVRGIVDWINNTLSHCLSVPAIVVELAQSMPGQGAPGCFNYGRHFGGFEAIATCFDLPYHEVRPNVWKKAMGLNAEKLNSITLCQRLFPGVNLIPEGCKTAKDGIAEACLIAEFARRARL